MGELELYKLLVMEILESFTHDDFIRMTRRAKQRKIPNIYRGGGRNVALVFQRPGYGIDRVSRAVCDVLQRAAAGLFVSYHVGSPCLSNLPTLFYMNRYGMSISLLTWIKSRAIISSDDNINVNVKR